MIRAVVAEIFSMSLRASIVGMDRFLEKDLVAHWQYDAGYCNLFAAFGIARIFLVGRLLLPAGPPVALECGCGSTKV